MGNPACRLLGSSVPSSRALSQITNLPVSGFIIVFILGNSVSPPVNPLLRYIKIVFGLSSPSVCALYSPSILYLTKWKSSWFSTGYPVNSATSFLILSIKGE